MNLKCELFKQSMNQIIQTSGLPIGVVYYIFKDLFHEIEKLYIATVNKEAMEQTNKNGETQLSPNTENTEVTENA